MGFFEDLEFTGFGFRACNLGFLDFLLKVSFCTVLSLRVGILCPLASILETLNCLNPKSMNIPCMQESKVSLSLGLAEVIRGFGGVRIECSGFGVQGLFGVQSGLR